MARPQKDGIDYFPFDVDFYGDKKIKLIKGEFGAQGIAVYIALLTEVYRDNGYYKRWDSDDCFLMSDGVGCGCTPNTVAEIVRGCVRRSLFDEGVFNAFGVLTSAGIQRRYLRAVAERSNIEMHKEYFLLETSNPKDVPERILNKLALKSVNPQNNGINRPENEVNRPDNPQSKVKESKGKKRKESRGFSPPTLDDVQSYCKERNSSVDPQRFYDYFTAGDWKDSKGNPVKNWKQKLITWEGNRGRDKPNTQSKPVRKLEAIICE